MDTSRINPASQIDVRLADLDDIRTVLLTVHTFHSARDISDSAANGVDQVRYRPITLEIERVLKRTEGLISQLVQKTIFEDEVDDDFEPEDPEVDPEEDEDEDEPDVEDEEDSEPEHLADNPLGSRTIVPPQSQFEWESS